MLFEKKKEMKALETIYSTVYDHFTEQDRLRNAIIAFFTTITGFCFQIDKPTPTKYLYLVLFVVGIILTFIMIRHKYYGEMYMMTLNTISLLFPCNPSSITKKLIEDKFEIVSNEYKCANKGVLARIKKYIWSVDSLLIIAFCLVNTINLYNFLDISNKQIICFVVVSFIVTIIVTFVVYHLLVVEAVKKLELKDLNFIRIFE